VAPFKYVNADATLITIITLIYTYKKNCTFVETENNITIVENLEISWNIIAVMRN